MGLGVSLHKLAMAGYGVTAGDKVSPRVYDSFLTNRKCGESSASARVRVQFNELIVRTTDAK